MSEQEEFEFRARLERESDKQPSWIDRVRQFAPLALSSVGGGLLKATTALDKAAYETGGKVTDLAAGHMPAEAAAGLGFVTNVGIQAAPSIILGQIGKAAAPSMEAGAKQLMQSALKPPKAALETGKAGRAIQTMLDEGVNVTPGGVMKLRGEIDELNKEISKRILTSNEVVDKQVVLNRLKGLTDKFKLQVNPQSDVKAIEKAWEEFATHPIISGSDSIPVQVAQKLKQGTYKALQDRSYGELGSSAIEAQKTLARGLKEEIARKVPGIAQLNKAEAELLNAESLASARALMDANKNPLGLVWLAMHPATWLGFAADRSPLIKSLVARAMYSGSEQIPSTVGKVVGAGIGMAQGTPPTQQ